MQVLAIYCYQLKEAIVLVDWKMLYITKINSALTKNSKLYQITFMDAHGGKTPNGNGVKQLTPSHNGERLPFGMVLKE